MRTFVEFSTLTDDERDEFVEGFRMVRRNVGPV